MAGLLQGGWGGTSWWW